MYAFPPPPTKKKKKKADRLNARRTSKNADDIVITLAIRTPLTKARKGGFKDTSLEYLVYAILKEVKERSGIDPGLIEDICLGNVCFLSAGASLSPDHFAQQLVDTKFKFPRVFRSPMVRPPTSFAPPLSPRESRIRPVQPASTVSAHLASRPLPISPTLSAMARSRSESPWVPSP